MDPLKSQHRLQDRDPVAVERDLVGSDELATALTGDEIHTDFQPKVDLRTGRVLGVEALVRWTHPERGRIGPLDLLAIAESGGHMRALTERVIQFSTRVASDWWRSGLGLHVSVNLPSSALSEPDWELHGFVARALAQSGLPAAALELEVTEGALLLEPVALSAALQALSDLGGSISVDQFGTGHFSIRQLQKLPIDELKIDRSFILDIEDNEEDRAVVRSMIHLAHQIGLQVTAVGVETDGVWRRLRSMGADHAQGHLIARPLSAREIPAWLATWNQRARELSSTKPGRRTAKATAAEKPAPAPA
jgi:EAL domain-containing protein (putative c-di-GMP-specific phosphodiesterase class I)